MRYENIVFDENSLIDEIVKRRKKSQMLQSRLAYKVGVSQSYISKLENKKKFSYKKTIKICKFLNIDIMNFVIWKESIKLTKKLSELKWSI